MDPAWSSPILAQPELHSHNLQGYTGTTAGLLHHPHPPPHGQGSPAHPAPTSAPSSPSHNHTCAKPLPYIRKRGNILGEPHNQTIFKIMEH